jgi:biopolymer transport protein ExbD
MASIGGGGGGHGGKKTVDQEIPLVPFIDLLLCCVMFLLVTAVWNQLARIEANQNVPSTSAPTDEPPPEERDKLTISITATGYTLSSTAGDSHSVPRSGENYNVDELRTKLQAWRSAYPNRHDITVTPEDGVLYQHVIETMDTARGEEWTEISLGAASF